MFINKKKYTELLESNRGLVLDMLNQKKQLDTITKGLNNEFKAYELLDEGIKLGMHSGWDWIISENRFRRSSTMFWSGHEYLTLDQFEKEVTRLKTEAYDKHVDSKKRKK